VAFSPDGRLIVTGSEDDQAELWEVDTGRLVDQLIGHAGYVLAVSFTPDGHTLATAGADQSIRLWNRQNGQGHKLTGHTNTVLGLAFRPDGAVLASGGVDETVRLWDVATGQPLGSPIAGLAGPVTALHFCRHGQLLCAVVAGNAGNKVRWWDLTTEDLLDRTYCIVPRNLSRDEWTELTGSPERYRPIFSSSGLTVH
jgi:WD40 repeat protein